MATAEMVRQAPPDPIKLDPAAQVVAVRRRPGLLEGQHLRLEKLQLKHWTRYAEVAARRIQICQRSGVRRRIEPAAGARLRIMLNLS
jgi:hypothetical protein